MADLIFGCTGATAERYAVTPTLTFQLTVTERSGVRIHAIALRCQIRIEPHRRRYSATEAERLHDLFGDPSRWPTRSSRSSSPPSPPWSPRSPR